jgi:hypothetical protein
MSYPIVYTWPAPDTQAICLTQTLTTAGNLSINGNLTVNLIQPGNAIFPGISRVVSITSANNLSGVNFTISGYLNGATVSETRAGPNATTVETAQLFDQVISVSANAAASAVSVGSGTTGRTHWFSYDYNRNVSSTTVQVNVTGTIDYTFNITLDDVQTNPTPFLTAPIAGMTNATTDQFATLMSGNCRYANVVINSSTNGSLIATILQTGIN